jgi:dethiobiotin synthetase
MLMRRGLFITGTDTGVGKTYLTCRIARTWRREGRSFRVMKPLATGDGEDTRLLSQASGQSDLSAISPFRFAEPAAPPVAARAEGVHLELERIVAAVREYGNETEALLVEGVGGLLCPLTERETVADLIAALRLPCIVVARRSLGTLNHTMLTLEVARHRGLKVAGVVISETNRPTSLAERENVSELQARCRVLDVLPFGSDAPDHVDWWSLMSGELH